MIGGVLETAAWRLKGAPVATIKVEAEIDVIKQCHLLQASATTKLSRLPKQRRTGTQSCRWRGFPRLSTIGVVWRYRS